MSIIYPVILAGGSGTRLWPLSRNSYPKQFSKLTDEKTLFQQTALRLTTSGQIEFSSHIILTNSDFRFIVAEQLLELGIDPDSILIEPEMKNTAPAILAATLFAFSKDKDAILLVAPSDHLIPDKYAFHMTVQAGLVHVQNGNIVTFGITPSHPETGYGYIEQSEETLDKVGSTKIEHFSEKPELSLAEAMLEKGNYLWNAGIFLFRAKDMIEAFKLCAPEMSKLISDAVNTAKLDIGFHRLNSVPWEKLNSISIDYAIMENIKNLVVVPYESKWTDLGGWDAVWKEAQKDEFGNAKSERAYTIDCSNTLLRSESVGQQIVGLGLNNIVAIAMRDAVLVACKEKSQDVNKVVAFLKENQIKQAEIFPKDHRPWGWFESLILSDSFQVKRIFVKPGASLSLQSHKYRSEHWIVVAGEARVTVDGRIELVGVGTSTHIPVGAIHRMENLGETPLILIEVQTGTYLGEDDIVRYEDLYLRN